MKYMIDMTKKQRNLLLRILVSTVLLLVLSLLPIDRLLRFILFLIPYLTAGHDVLRKAGNGLWNRQLFDENFLMAVATLGALLLGVTQSGDYAEAVTVMVLYRTEELFQSCALAKAAKTLPL